MAMFVVNFGYDLRGVDMNSVKGRRHSKLNPVSISFPESSLSTVLQRSGNSMRIKIFFINFIWIQFLLFDRTVGLLIIQKTFTFFANHQLANVCCFVKEFVVNGLVRFDNCWKINQSRCKVPFIKLNMSLPKEKK